MHALDTHSPTSYLPQSYINISIISLVYHVELYVLWKHSGQHPNYLKATPIYQLLVSFTIQSYGLHLTKSIIFTIKEHDMTW